MNEVNIPDFFCDELNSKPLTNYGTILVTGATGYIGGRLVPELLARGYKVRIMVRNYSPELLKRWPEVEIAVADASDYEQLRLAMRGVQTAYFMIHALLKGPGKFESLEVVTAENFKRAAEAEEVKRVIYLGGLGDTNTELSDHLKSRIRVADILKHGSYKTTVLKAAIIIGSGGSSYEILKHLVADVPVLLLPYWGDTLIQPIGIRDVIKYLVGVLEVSETAGQDFDIGCDDIYSYETLLRIIARQLNKERIFIRAPALSINFYAYSVSLFTPVPAPITYCLMEGCKNTVICQERKIKEYVPFQPLSFKECIKRALGRELNNDVHTRWTDSYPPAHDSQLKLHELENSPRFISTYSMISRKSARDLFFSILRIGGSEGWFYYNWMWILRGLVDRIFMGVGTLRGKRKTRKLRINDVIDFWRVEDLQEDSRLLLRAEMKLPGYAWLEFKIIPEKEHNLICLTAYFSPKKIPGKIYWYAFLPFHHFIFNDMLQQIEARSRSKERKK